MTVAEISPGRPALFCRTHLHTQLPRPLSSPSFGQWLNWGENVMSAHAGHLWTSLQASLVTATSSKSISVKKTSTLWRTPVTSGRCPGISPLRRDPMTLPLSPCVREVASYKCSPGHSLSEIQGARFGSRGSPAALRSPASEQRGRRGHRKECADRPGQATRAQNNTCGRELHAVLTPGTLGALTEIRCQKPATRGWICWREASGTHRPAAAAVDARLRGLGLVRTGVS